MKKCSNIEVQREIFIQLGKIVYGIWNEKNPMNALELLFQDFVDQTAFMKYFKSFWVPKLGKYFSHLLSYYLANKLSLHVRSQGIEILTLIGEK